MITEGPIEILLVEDNPNDVELTLHALKRFCPVNQIHVARDGVEAVDFIFCTGQYSERSITNQPRIILLDLKLPRLNGIEVLERLKSDSRTRSIPVVVLSSSSDHDDIHNCYQLGVNSYIVKPVDFDEFLNAARTIGAYWLDINHSNESNP